jgi:hypothetical protein
LHLKKINKNHNKVGRWCADVIYLTNMESFDPNAMVFKRHVNYCNVSLANIGLCCAKGWPLKPG